MGLSTQRMLVPSVGTSVLFNYFSNCRIFIDAVPFDTYKNGLQLSKTMNHVLTTGAVPTLYFDVTWLVNMFCRNLLWLCGAAKCCGQTFFLTAHYLETCYIRDSHLLNIVLYMECRVGISTIVSVGSCSVCVYTQKSASIPRHKY